VHVVSLAESITRVRVTMHRENGVAILITRKRDTIDTYIYPPGARTLLATWLPSHASRPSRRERERERERERDERAHLRCLAGSRRGCGAPLSGAPRAPKTIVDKQTAEDSDKERRASRIPRGNLRSKSTPPALARNARVSSQRRCARSTTRLSGACVAE